MNGPVAVPVVCEPVVAAPVVVVVAPVVAAPVVAAEFKAKYPDWTGNAVAADVRKIYTEAQ